MKKRLDKSIYNYIEYELYNYNNSKKELKMDEEDAIYGVNEFDLNAGIRAKYKKSNKVENSAIKILSTKKITKLTATIKAIDNALNTLEKIYNEFFCKYYLDRYGKLKICEKLGLSERSFYNYKNKIVWTVAREMGFMDYE